MMTSFTIFPAIDMRGGEVVRLKFGDPNQKTVYDSDPVVAAKRWMKAGTEWLHVVNLDGAFGDDNRANWDALLRLTLLPVKIQFGGGIRTMDDIGRLLGIGVKRVILGTIAVKDPAFVGRVVTKYGAERVVIGLDARDGMVKTHGWQEDSGLTVEEVGRRMKSLGVETVLHTDIGRDGVLTGVNWQASQALAQATGLSVLGSGGVADMSDIEACMAAEGITGVITGRAIYDGRLNLEKAIEWVAQSC